MADKSPIIAITPGDPDGIGPEILSKALRKGVGRKNGVKIVCIGAEAPFLKLGAKVRKCEETSDFAEIPLATKDLFLVPAPHKAPTGKHLGGFQSGWSIKKSVELISLGVMDALVTGPISKEHLQLGGFPYQGHTEFLAKLCSREKTAMKSGEVTMMLSNSQLRVSLVTTHLALKDVSKNITREKIFRSVQQTLEHLTFDCKIKLPTIAVTALNPHAGETGLFGEEEIKVITPAVKDLQKLLAGRCKLVGPLPADTLFTRIADYDAVVCMYHDQGLIPVKLLDFSRTVNITLGLPMIRTSVDHGVAFDIAGKGIADPSSLEAAIAMAAEFIRNRGAHRNA